MSDRRSITLARRSVPLRRVKSKAPALRRNRAPHETQSEQNIYTRDRRKAGALLSTRRSGTLRRAWDMILTRMPTSYFRRIENLIST
jgi:hypothetical protein